MPAATATEWLTAAAIGTSSFLPIAAAVLLADRDLHLPHVSLAGVENAAEQAALKVRLALAAWLLVLAWHLESGEASR